MGSDSCEIFTDVPAICTADPRLVKDVTEIKTLEFEEMMEMASLGSKVLHIRCVELAAKFGVKIHLRSTFEKREGTWVVPEGESMENPVVSAVTHDASTPVIKLFPVPMNQGYLSKLFQSLADKNIVVDIITQSHNEEGQRLAFSLPEEDVLSGEEVVREILGPDVNVTVFKEMAKISTVGVGMKNHPGVAARFFTILNDLEVPIHLVTTSEIKIFAVIDRKNLEKAANGLHLQFALDLG
jgi:Aspartokinases